MKNMFNKNRRSHQREHSTETDDANKETVQFHSTRKNRNRDIEEALSGERHSSDKVDETMPIFSQERPRTDQPMSARRKLQSQGVTEKNPRAKQIEINAAKSIRSPSKRGSPRQEVSPIKNWQKTKQLPFEP